MKCRWIGFTTRDAIYASLDPGSVPVHWNDQRRHQLDFILHTETVEGVECFGELVPVVPLVPPAIREKPAQDVSGVEGPVMNLAIATGRIDVRHRPDHQLHGRRRRLAVLGNGRVALCRVEQGRQSGRAPVHRFAQSREHKLTASCRVRGRSGNIYCPQPSETRCRLGT